MDETFVSRKEFEKLEQKVDNLENTMNQNVSILTAIDKKVDLINAKITTSDTIEDLKLQPINKRVSAIEDGQKWLWRTIGTTLIGIVIKAVFDISKVL